SFKKLPAHLSCADKLREQPEVLGFMPDPTRHNCRMYFESLRQLHDRKRCGVLAYSARLPDFGRNETLLGPIVGLIFLRVASHALDASQAQVVDESLVPL